MKILHLCLYGPYTDGFSYQENLIPIYHKKMGLDVIIVANNTVFDYSGGVTCIEEGTYVDSNDIKIYRMAYKRILSSKFTHFFAKVNLRKLLEEEMPDIIFVHDAQLSCLSYLSVLKYKKRINPNVVIVGDIHTDIYNAELVGQKKKSFFKTLFKVSIQKFFRKRIYPMYRKIYCVAQSSHYYAKNICHISETKLKLLPLGFDTDIYDLKDKIAIRKRFRELYSFSDSDIVLIHGGKLDKKKMTIELINAVSMINNSHVKLLIFGGANASYLEEIKSLVIKYNDWLTYVGPLKQSDYYDAFISADIAVFPGGQSSLWQEAIGCRLPIIVYYRDGQTQYLNRNGNAMFIPKQSVAKIKETLELALNKVDEMKLCAEKAYEFFSYKNEAEEIIRDCEMRSENI